MTRAEALQHIYERFRAMLGAARIPLEDSPDGVKSAIDDALIRCGVPLAGPVPADQLERFAVALKVALYRLILHVFTTKYDKTFAGITLQQFDMFNGTIKLLADAKAEAAALGLNFPRSSYQEINLRPSTARLRDEFGHPDLEPI